MSDNEGTHLTMIKGGRIAPRDFNPLPVEEKRRLLMTRPAREKLDLIISDPRASELVRSLSPLELYLTLKEIGDDDSGEVIPLAATDQLMFCLDLELWKRWSFSHDKALKWLTAVVEGGEQLVNDLLHEGDPDLFVLILMREIQVGGGAGELVSDDERLGEWDHSFDNLYYISFKNRQHAKLIGTLLDILFRRYQPLYAEVMERVRSETVPEMEELCYQTRNARLAENGFPDPVEAAAIYAYVDPKGYRLKKEKQLKPAQVGDNMILRPAGHDSVWQRVLQASGSPDLMVEFNYLVNNALVADDVDVADTGAVEALLQRVDGYLSIALDWLSGGDEGIGAGIVQSEYLKDLFRLGFSTVLDLQRQANRIETDDYATGKVLAGLRAKRPLFYRGLDPDAIDGYREFRSLDDVEKVKALLGD